MAGNDNNMATKLLDATKELEKLPDINELNRLVKYYPTYEWEHRMALLNGYFQGKTLSELVNDKLKAKNIDKSGCNHQSLGGHARWVKEKVRKTIIRLLYLRYRLDQGLTQRQANQQILIKYPSPKNTQDAGQSAIRKMTHSTILDKQKVMVTS